MSTNPKLTIAIPTFNRPEELAETLRRLVPQVSDDWVLHIHDNCSEPPIAETQAELLAQFDKNRFTIIRNVANIGANANILRCFELCETEWLVVLGDDDLIEPDYVSSFLNLIAEHPDIVFANFASCFNPRKADITTTGLAGFCQGLDEWGNVLFITASIFNRKAVVPYLRYGYNYIYALSPHIALVMQCLRQGHGKCMFLKKEIVSSILVEARGWPGFNTNKYAYLLELIPDRPSQEAFFKRISVHLIPARRVASFLIERFHNIGEDARARFEMRASCLTFLRTSFLDFVTLPFLRFFVRHPRLGSRIVRLGRRCRGYPPPKQTGSMDIFSG